MEWGVVAVAGWVGAVAFALSGFLAGARKHLDLVGIFIVMMLTGNGGGALRDIMLGRVPLVLQSSLPFLLALGVLSVGWGLRLERFARIERHGLFVLCDAVGLVAFSLTGANAGIEAGLPIFGVMALAFLTAVGGGILRDVLLGDIPALLSSDFYGSVALVVAAGLVGLQALGWRSEFTTTGLLAFALGLRLLAWHKGWQLPRLRLPGDR